VPAFIKWAFVDAVWWSDGQACNLASGACWSVVTKNIRFILFGFYPYDQQWRPVLSIGLLAAFVFYSSFQRNWNKRLLIAWPVGLALIGLIMHGGIFGLPSVEAEKWSGISLTLLLSIFGLSAAYPFGVILALGPPLKPAGHKDPLRALHRTDSWSASDQHALYGFGDVSSFLA
jgi:general L-amino acid transport system permease protein